MLALVSRMAPVARSSSSAQLHDAMRKLWSDHVVWTGLYIIAAAAGDASAQTAAARLLRNQEDIGNAIAPYACRAAGMMMRAFSTPSTQIIGMADALSDGIVKQFPARFTS